MVDEDYIARTASKSPHVIGDLRVNRWLPFQWLRGAAVCRCSPHDCGNHVLVTPVPEGVIIALRSSLVVFTKRAATISVRGPEKQASAG